MSQNRITPLTARHRRDSRIDCGIRMAIAVLTFWWAFAVDGAETALVSDQPAFTFETHIRPILRTYCLDCHGGEAELQGGLDLRLRRLIIQGGSSGPAIEPGSPEASLLYQRIRDGEMPPRDKKLSERERDIINNWIAAGAKTARDEPAEVGHGIGVSDEDRAFWSFQPIRRPTPPTASSPRDITPIDTLLSAQQRRVGLTWSAEAGKLTLLRRATIDLTGLPPTLEQVESFLADGRVDAYDRLLDRLLASNHYGERWGRHWLDVAGYADSEGGTTADVVRQFAYKFRDYVIRAFNSDKPWDRFITEQLAGDELVDPPYQDLTPDKIEFLVATGFLRMAPDGTGSGASDQEAARNQVMADTIKIVSSSLLGLTVGCAQCHDHKHDPILQADYYRLRAIFEPALDWKNWRVPAQREISLYSEADRAQAREIESEAAKVSAERATKQSEFIKAALEKELDKFDAGLRAGYRVAYFTPESNRRPDQKRIFDENPFLRINASNLYQYNAAAAEELKKFDESIAKIRSKKPFEDFIRPLTEIPGKFPHTFLFQRGDPKQPKEVVQPGGLSILSPDGMTFKIPEKDPYLTSTGRRSAFARWLTTSANALVSRVIVNRAWMLHFGKGLVDTPSDFGNMGVKPTHPELLDWLADEFISQAWSLKRLHKTIMCSTAYCQASERDAQREAIDPGNQHYWHKPIQRLEAEAVRDCILAVAGQLDSSMFGSPVPAVEDELGQIVVAKGKEGLRRSVYLQVRRSTPVSLLQQFDFPLMEVNCEKRILSTVSTQALILMNSEFILEQAEEFAARVRREAGDDLRSQVALAWQQAFSRPASSAELDHGVEFLQTQIAHVTETLKALESSQSNSTPEKTAEDKTQGNSTSTEQKKPTIKLLDPPVQALTNLCQSLLSCHEFLYLE